MFDPYDNWHMPEQPEPEPLKLDDILVYQMPGETLGQMKARQLEQFLAVVKPTWRFGLKLD